MKSTGQLIYFESSYSLTRDFYSANKSKRQEQNHTKYKRTKWKFQIS